MHQAIVVTDLTFGDAGKGSVTDALVRRGAQLVVRYNGGAQAAHTVVEESGRAHIFHQFGSGTLVEGVETFLSCYVLVNPLALYWEEADLQAIGVTDAFQRMHVDARALVTTHYHVIANRLREIARAHHRHGSCGMGIGETASDALASKLRVLRFGDLRNDGVLHQKLRWHRDQKRRVAQSLLPQLNQLPAEVFEEKVVPLLDQLESHEELEAACEAFAVVAASVNEERADFLAGRMQKSGCTVFEGAQGVLLDENWGFHPHTTWATTTSHNALQLIGETNASPSTIVLGLTRAYQTRHGAGPLPTEDEQLTHRLREPHNPTNQWQGPFRAGWLDVPLLRYAITCNRDLDGLIVTCLDRLEELPQVQIGAEYTLNTSPWKPNPLPLSLADREAEGKALRKVNVSYASAPREPFAYASKVSEMLQIPLLGTSCGSCASDKAFLF